MGREPPEKTKKQKKKTRYPGYKTKLHLMVKLYFGRSGESGVPIRCHYSKVHWPELVVLIRVPLLVQIDLFKKDLYSKRPGAKKKT